MRHGIKHTPRLKCHTDLSDDGGEIRLGDSYIGIRGSFWAVRKHLFFVGTDPGPIPFRSRFAHNLFDNDGGSELFFVLWSSPPNGNDSPSEDVAFELLEKAKIVSADTLLWQIQQKAWTVAIDSLCSDWLATRAVEATVEQADRFENRRSTSKHTP